MLRGEKCLRRLLRQDRGGHGSGSFYDLLLNLPESSRVKRTPAARPLQEDADKLAKAKAVFGDRTAIRVNETMAHEEQTRILAGVRVPPKPEEPLFCCGSGCVNCVWLLYKEDMDTWMEQKNKAFNALRAENKPLPPDFENMRDEERGMDNLDPGLRAFIEVERRLRDRREERKRANGGA